MSVQIPALVFLAPFLAAVSMPLIGHRNRAACRPVALGAVAAMTVLATIGLWQVIAHGTVRYSFGGWAGPVGIEWVADPVSAAVAVAVSGIALICLLYAGSAAHAGLDGRTVPYYSIVLLLLSGLVGATYAGDLFNIFVFIEVVALSGYALVAVAGGKALVAAFRYLVMGTLGATFYLLGVAYIYAATGSLNIADLAQSVPGLLESKAVIGGLLFIFAGLSIKMALVPLHGWLPDAYSTAPDAAVPLLAGLVTKIVVLVWARILFWVAAAGFADGGPNLFTLVASLGVLASVCGGLLAVSQDNLKRMFAYGGIAHIGVAMIGLGQANQTALAGALFYLLNDAVQQCALFMLAGVLLRHGVAGLQDAAGRTVRGPWMFATLVAVGFGMIGLPPTGGFFGKWYILLGTLEAGSYAAAAAIVLTTLLTVAYFARLFAKLFRSGPAESETAAIEGGPAFKASLAVPALAVIALGIWSDPIISALLDLTGGLGL